MDTVDVCAATSTADNAKRRGHNKNRDWLKRLHLRKAALQAPAMQTPDKPGPKKIVAAEKHAGAVWPSSKKLRSQETPQRMISSGNTLRFKCSQCTDNIERGPKELSVHFEEKHKGCPPVFSCHLCKFTTHEFSYLQVHVLSHKDTFSCCSLCNDNVQRTWPEFSAHLTLVHTQNGKYCCDVCKKFSTLNDKEFLEHVLLHNLGLDRKNDQTISKTSYHCQFCGYEASQKVILTKHMKTVHDGVNCSQKNKDVFPMNETKRKPRMTRSAVKDISWLTQDCLSLPGREFLDKYCHLSDAQTTLEETQQFLLKSGKQKWSKALKNVLSNVPQEVNLQSKLEKEIASVFPDSSQDVLTVKNKMNQNGASFAKRLKLMTEKEAGNANADLCGKIVSDVSLSDCLQNQEAKLSGDVAVAESTETAQTEENRENQRLKTDLSERDGEEAIQDGAILNELKAEERKAVRKALPKKKRKNMRWRNAKKSKNVDKLKTALALKIILKKNPKKGKQWVTQAALPRANCNSTVNDFTTCIKKSVCKREGTIKDKHETGHCGIVNTVEKQKDKTQNGGESAGEAVRLVNGTKEKSHEKSRHDGFTKASPLLESVITPQSK
ncbi:hypothetical protein NL108_004688, partial [Boleophthalmus pectinirostris]